MPSENKFQTASLFYLLPYSQPLPIYYTEYLAYFLLPFHTLLFYILLIIYFRYEQTFFFIYANSST